MGNCFVKLVGKGLKYNFFINVVNVLVIISVCNVLKLI